jgi:MFS family permease
VHPIRRAAAWSRRVPGGRDGRRMLAIALVDRIGSGLWASVSVLYFTYVSELSLAEVGTLAAAAGAIGIAGAPMGGKLADRFPITRVLLTVQLIRAVASCALLSTDNYALLIAFSAVGGLGDRAASILTKLYATRVAGPERVRYQAFHRTAAVAGRALGGLVAAAVPAVGSTAAYQWLLAGEAPSPPRSNRPHDRVGDPGRERTYLAYVATETVLFLMAFNNVMIVALQATPPDSAPPQRLPGTLGTLRRPRPSRPPRAPTSASTAWPSPCSAPSDHSQSPRPSSPPRQDGPPSAQP